MPYKNKEDRTEAVRRHRQRKKEGQKMQSTLSETLRKNFGFHSMPYAYFVRIAQEDCRVEGEDVIDKGTGEKHGKIEVLFGLNMIIAIETPRMFAPEEGEIRLPPYD